jgi:peptidyl-prolyl cis-trans isomerase SurA
MRNFAPRRTGLFCAALGMLAAAVLWQASARAQTSIVAIVDGTPITSSEVSERQVVVRLTRKQQISKKEALEQVIDIYVLREEAKRRQISVPESEVDQRFAAVAAGSKMTPEQLDQALLKAGASGRSLKAEIRSGLMQRKLMGMLSRLSTGISEKEIAAGITAKRSEGAGTAYRYTMQQIVFVTDKKASAGQISQRTSEAEALRRRAKSCDEAVAMAKNLRDVAVKPPIVRNSSQLPNAFRDMLAGMKVGQSTKADKTELGVEIIVICEKQETADDSALRSEVQAELTKEQGKADVDKFVADLRRRASVIYR